MLPDMFIVDEETTAAIRRALDEGGELSAVIELRRQFPGITDNARARACVRLIAGWSPGPTPKKDPKGVRYPGRNSRV
jgi:hypothetical protein